MKKMEPARQQAHDFLNQYRYFTERLRIDATELRQFEKIKNERTQFMIDRLTEAIQWDTKKLIITREEIIKIIDDIKNEDKRQVLLYRYVNGFRIDEIEDKMYLSRRRIQQLLASALDEVYEMIKKENNTVKIAV